MTDIYASMNEMNKESELYAFARKKARQLGMKGYKKTDLDGILWIAMHCLMDPAEKETGYKLMELAAEKGHAEAQARHGMRFFFGEGVPIDPARSIYWFKLSAAQKDAMGMNSLGHCLLHGIGIDADAERGFELTREAARLDNANACEGLGYCYFNGIGTAKDPDLARLWWERAAAGGDDEAKENLILHFGVKQEDLSLEPYNMLKDAFNSAVFDYFTQLLTGDAVYSSIWLEEPIHGGEEITKYLFKKAEDVFKTNSVKHARLVRLLGTKAGYPEDEELKLGHYAVELENRDNTSMVLLEGEDPYVRRMAVLNADHFDYEVIPEPELMTQQERHEFGIDIVCRELEKEGYSIDSVEIRMKMFPQIVAKKDGITYMIVVATEVAPFTGQQLIEPLKKQLSQIARDNGAVACFTSVSIGAENVEHFAKSIARRNSVFRTRFLGLELMEGKSNLN